MRKLSAPTTGANAQPRLFLRFFLFYFIAVIIGVLLAFRGLLPVDPIAVGMIQLILLLLSRLGALLTVTGPYLLLLTAIKGFYDAAILFYFTRMAQLGAIGILPWNACFFLIAFTAVIFATSSAQAAWFVFLHPERDLRLLFSTAFGRYLIATLLYSAMAICFYFLWPQIYALLG